jgi:hypothetical protein
MATLNVSDLNRQGKVFTAANVSAKSIVAVSTTATGLMVYNPNGSGVNLVLIDMGWAFTTAPAAVVQVGVALMPTNPAVPTSLTVAGSPAADAGGRGQVGAGVAWDAATLPVAPVARRWSLSADFESAVGSPLVSCNDRIDGSLIVVPGALAIICALTTTGVGVGSLTWAEIPR